MKKITKKEVEKETKETKETMIEMVQNTHTKDIGVVVSKENGKFDAIFSVIVLRGQDGDTKIKSERWYKGDIVEFKPIVCRDYNNADIILARCKSEERCELEDELELWCENINKDLENGKKLAKVKELLGWGLNEEANPKTI